MGRAIVPRHAKVFVQVPASARSYLQSPAPATNGCRSLGAAAPPTVISIVNVPPVSPHGASAAVEDLGADGLFAAMGDPVRRRLLMLLCEAGRAHVTMLCELARLPRAAVGHHLKDLKLRGLIFARQQGRHVWYQCDPASVRLDHQAGRFFLTVTHPGGAGVTLFGPATSATPIRD
jgi:DNA-binding transcriptional ArsR family regulator